MNEHVLRRQGLMAALVRRAARNAPSMLRERLEEEWLAHLGERTGVLSRLRFALGCHWATQVICFERRDLVLAHAGDGPLAPRRTPLLTRRAASLVVVVALHALLFYACWATLARTHQPPLPSVFEYRPVPHTPPPPFQPSGAVDLSRVSLTLPVPPPSDPLIESDPGSSAGDARAVVNSPSVVVPEIRHAPQRIVGGPAAGFPNVDDFYPPAAMRAGEQGSATVQVCVNERGRLDVEPALLQSSGAAKLDAAALKLAKSASGRYRPTTEDGRAVSSCFAFAVRFQIRNVR